MGAAVLIESIDYSFIQAKDIELAAWVFLEKLGHADFQRSSGFVRAHHRLIAFADDELLNHYPFTPHLEENFVSCSIFRSIAIAVSLPLSIASAQLLLNLCLLLSVGCNAGVRD